MRTDLITACLIHEWLEEHIPEIADEWHLEVDEQIKTLANLLKNTVTNVKSTLVSQHLVARLAIESWHLENVALIGGGRPTPLSPKPDQLLYFADINAEVVEEARAAGYNACQVDITKADQLKRLEGATTVVAPGLAHFLPDVAISGMLRSLAHTGFETVIVNHANQNLNTEGSAGAAEYKKMGVDVYFRSTEELRPLIPDDWRIDLVVTAREALVSIPEMKPHVDSIADINDIYRLVRA